MAKVWFAKFMEKGSYNDQKREDFVVLSKFLSLNFPWNDLKGTFLLYTTLLCRPHVWQNFPSQIPAQSPLHQLNYRVVWSEVPLEQSDKSFCLYYTALHSRKTPFA